MKENKLLIFSPFYNAENFIEKCIQSVKSQKYDNYIHVIINDASIDNSHLKVLEQFNNLTKINNNKDDKEIYKGEKIIYIKNKNRVGALSNLVYTLQNFAHKNDIACSLDGDDWLLNRNVFSYINKIFIEKNIKFMYGGSMWTDGNKCCSRPYNQVYFDNIRKGREFYLLSQMRNFRVESFFELQKQDEKLKSLKDKKGEFYKMTHDVAFYLPIMEIVGLNNIYHNTKQIYVYNRDNPINDDKVNQKLQWDIHEEILKKSKFKQVF